MNKILQNNTQINIIKKKIITVCKLIYDPELSINIWDLGLIYNINISLKSIISIEMTLTSPTCPIAGIIITEITKKIKLITPNKKNIILKLIWTPQWNQSMISEEAKFALNLI